jgi:hypothetical protein
MEDGVTKSRFLRYGSPTKDVFKNKKKRQVTLLPAFKGWHLDILNP